MTEYECNQCKANGVVTKIYFDNRIKSQSGKMIPQEVATKQNHTCPYRKGASAPAQAGTTTQPTPVVPPVNMDAVLASLAEVKAGIGRIETSLASLVLK